MKRTDRTVAGPDRQALADALVAAGWDTDTHQPATASNRNRLVLVHQDGREVRIHLVAGSVTIKSGARHSPAWQIRLDHYVPNDACFGAAVGAIRPAAKTPCRTVGDLKALLATVPDHHEIDVAVETLETDGDGSRWRTSVKGPLTTVGPNPMHPALNLFSDLPRVLPASATGRPAA